VIDRQPVRYDDTIFWLLLFYFVQASQLRKYFLRKQKSKFYIWAATAFVLTPIRVGTSLRRAHTLCK
jgi:hypothetical protein